MTKYRAAVACDPSSYGTIEFEADNPEAAIAKIDVSAILEAVGDVEYDGAQNFRIVDIHEIDENDDDGELVAECIDVGGDCSPSIPNLAALLAAGDALASLMVDAESTHIYDLGDKQPADCSYLLARQAWAAAKAGAEPPTSDNPIAPGEFEKAILLGYRVERDEDPATPAPAWRVFDPDDQELDITDDASAWPSERAAWEAADNHRMFGDVTGAV